MQAQLNIRHTGIQSIVGKVRKVNCISAHQDGESMFLTTQHAGVTDCELRDVRQYKKLWAYWDRKLGTQLSRKL